jgi:2-isopropylmalate synthase
MQEFETSGGGRGYAQVRVLDTTLRDGEQSAGVAFTLRDKLEISERLEALGVDVIEAGFPTSCQADFEAVAAVARARRRAGVCALVRAIPADVDRTAEALRGAAAPRLHVFVSTSEIHLAHQLRRDVEQVEAMVRAAVARARGHCDDVEFSPMDATRSAPAVLARVVRAAVLAGATTVNVPDTVGCALPSQLAALLRELRRAVPELEACTLSFHGQDDLGLATGNALAAVEAGARQLELTANGIGERAGNTSLEEVVVALRLHRDALGADTRIDTRGLWPLARLVEARSGLRVAPNKAIVGRNAFRHASGIHQDGMVKERSTYELFDPAAIGHPGGSQIVLGKLSGRAGFAVRLRALGLELEPAELERAFARFKRVAERVREVDDQALRTLVGAGEATRGEVWPGPGV